MNLRTFYESTGVDYDAFLQRMRGKEALIEKYIRIFMEDHTYEQLTQAMGEGDLQAIEVKAHTLKGIAMNMNLDKLAALSADMVNSARSCNMLELESQFKQVREEYTFIIENLGS